MIAAVAQNRFDGGEISPLLYGRVDAEKYKASLALCQNWYPTLQGALTRRQGTQYIGALKSSSAQSFLIPFTYSTTQSYILEFGNLYIRFWANLGQVTSGMSALEVVSPYAQADLSTIKYTQSADTLYLVHPNYAPYKLVRFSATSWQLVKIQTIDGPYLPEPDSRLVTAGTLGGTTGRQTISFAKYATITAVANNGGLVRITVDTNLVLETGDPVFIDTVDGGAQDNRSWYVTRISSTVFDLQSSTWNGSVTTGGFVSPVVFASYVYESGRPFRMKIGSTWAWGTLDSTDDTLTPTGAKIRIFGTATGTAVTSYQKGAWSGFNGYPSAVSFYQDRLVFNGPPLYPQQLDMSRSRNYENFAPSRPADAVVEDSSAIGASLIASDVNAINWLSSEEKALVAGATSAEWNLRPSNISGALSPTNISAQRSTKWGVANAMCVQAGRATIFIQRGGKKLRELHYYFDIDGYRAADLTELAEHITGTGITQIVYQSIPQSIVWCLRNDGVLLGMTYDRDQLALKAGWHKHTLGGQSDTSGTNPVIESIAVIPSQDGTRDDLWMVVRRRINGATARYVEVLSPQFSGVTAQQDALFVDCSLTYDVPKTITAISLASPAVITSATHGFSTGDVIRITDVVGVKTSNATTGTSVVNELWAAITVINANSFSIPINTSAATAYVSGGKVRKRVSNISGLSHLEGESVSILADGAVLAAQTVASGAIALPSPGTVIQIGLSYNSDAQTLRVEGGSRNGTALGKSRRTHRMGIMAYRSQGLLIGKDFSSLDPVQFRTQDVDLNGRPPALFSGVESHPVEFDYDFDNTLCMRVSDPVPCTIQALMPQLEVQDRA